MLHDKPAPALRVSNLPSNSLARSVGRPTALCVTCCILFSHGFFFWAQYGADMMSINLTAKVMWETRGPLAAAVGLLERSICNTDCLFEGHEPVRTGSTLADTLCNTISCSSCERTHRRCS